jgi:hypothetical protein
MIRLDTGLFFLDAHFDRDGWLKNSSEFLLFDISTLVFGDDGRRAFLLNHERQGLTAQLCTCLKLFYSIFSEVTTRVTNMNGLNREGSLIETL